jgi:hypothetical protein
MDNEKMLYAKNETLRIVGMYSFLFYAVACGVFFFKPTCNKCFNIICGIVVCISAAVFFIYAGIIIYNTNKNNKDKICRK